jgi:hypothetical protein
VQFSWESQTWSAIQCSLDLPKMTSFLPPGAIQSTSAMLNILFGVNKPTFDRNASRSHPREMAIWDELSLASACQLPLLCLDTS